RKAAFTNAFAQRTEFTDAYNGLTNIEYVQALMGRYSLTQIITRDPANPDGDQKVTRTTQQLIDDLTAATLTRAQVLRMIADSDQVFSLEFNRRLWRCSTLDISGERLSRQDLIRGCSI
ncbi:MAG TPA: hypothetical protein VMM84_15085, partial [Pyrinomonadaceae bacterium]|nr:hypothetical protein [Pyrinomonadaceae bacterium]